MSPFTTRQKHLPGPRTVGRLTARRYVALLVGLLSMLGAGCLAEPELPTCPDGDDQTCLAHGDGFCRCVDGLCFRFDCPVSPQCSSGELSERLECLIVRADVADAIVAPPVVGADDSVVLLTGAGLARLGTDGRVTRSEHQSAFAPVHLGQQVALTGPGLRLVGADLSGAAEELDLADRTPVSAPLPWQDGLVVVASSGELVVARSGQLAILSPVVLPPSEQAWMSWDRQDGTLWVTTKAVEDSASGLYSIPLDAVLATGAGITGLAPATLVDGVVDGPPALGGDGFVVAPAGNALHAHRLDAGGLRARNPVNAGFSAFEPVIGGGETPLVVASFRSSGRVSAYEWTATGPVPVWEVVMGEGLTDAAGATTEGAQLVAAPTLGGGEGREVVVGLDDGRVLGLVDGLVRWSARFSAPLAGPAVQRADGAWVLALTDGTVTIQTGVVPPALPWPRARGDAQGSGRSPGAVPR